MSDALYLGTCSLIVLSHIIKIQFAAVLVWDWLVFLHVRCDYALLLSFRCNQEGADTNSHSSYSYYYFQYNGLVQSGVRPNLHNRSRAVECQFSAGTQRSSVPLGDQAQADSR